MFSDLWYRVSKTVFPFISLKRYYAICDDYDAAIGRMADCIDDQADMIETLRTELDDKWYPPHTDIDPLSGLSPAVKALLIDDDPDIARMEGDGCVDPNRYGKD